MQSPALFISIFGKIVIVTDLKYTYAVSYSIFEYLVFKKNVLNSYCKNPAITSQQMPYNAAILLERSDLKTEKV